MTDTTVDLYAARGFRWRTPFRRIDRALLGQIAFALALIAGIGVIAWVGLRRPAEAPATQMAIPQRQALPGQPPEAPPVVDPNLLMPIDRAAAIAMNNAVPFSTAPNPAAAPLVLTGAPDDIQRATDCLTAAVLYEAGDDAEGQKAVAQVVINRVRHPAFPNTVCGVVFQGSERATGCQFTFTCDGALVRRYPQEMWQRAQEVAKAALTGSVYAPVGTATHYHTNWVVPYWSSSLDKITAVGTHLFFRWKGWWGTPPAFGRPVAEIEEIEPALAEISDVHKTAEELAQIRLGAALEKIALRQEGDTFLIGWDKSMVIEDLPGVAAALCGANLNCRVLGWQGGESALPMAGDNARLMRAAFYYQPGEIASQARTLWDCRSIKRENRAECLTAKDLKGIKLPTASAAELAVLATTPATPFIEPAYQPLVTTQVEKAADATPGKTVAPTVVAAAEVAPKRKRRDPCAAMRMVADADRIGPCSREDF